MTRRPTHPATPAAKRVALNAGRYSLVSEDRNTIPPSAPDSADVEAFESDVREHGEAQARMKNLLRRTRP